MVVAVIAVRMMKVSVNQIVHMIAMRNGGVTAIGAVDVLPVMAFRAQRAFVGIHGADRDDVFVHVVTMRMMQMAVVKIIHVPLMHDGDVPAILAVDVRMIVVSRAGMRFVHRFYFWFKCYLCAIIPSQLNHRCGWCGKKCFCKRLALNKNDIRLFTNNFP